MTIYLKEATYIDWETLKFKHGNLAISTRLEKPLEFIDQIPDDNRLNVQDRVVDCEGKLVTKSFACGHHHIYSTLSRGMPAPAKDPENFVEKLKYVWWNLDKNLTLDMIRASALASALYCAKNGVTFVIDHHASPFAIEGSLNAIREAFEAVGISHLLCYEISERDGLEVRDQGLAETRQYLSENNPGLVGLHASFTIGNDTLQKAIALAEEFSSGVHIHVAEDRADQDDCLEKYGTRVVERLHQFGALALPKTILAHCIHLEEKEVDLLKNSPAWVVENIESNANNNVGFANHQQYSNRVMLGTDGMHSDMLRSAKAAFLYGQATEKISFPGIYDRFRNVHLYLSENSFRGDGNNNLVILDYDSPTEINADNFLGHFVFGIDSKHVESVISNGKLIVEKRKLMTVDESRILSFAREMGKQLWKKL